MSGRATATAVEVFFFGGAFFFLGAGAPAGAAGAVGGASFLFCVAAFEAAAGSGGSGGSGGSDVSTADAAVADFGAPCLTLVLMIRFGLAAAAAAAGSVMVGIIHELWQVQSIDRCSITDASISCRTSLAQLCF